MPRRCCYQVAGFWSTAVRPTETMFPVSEGSKSSMRAMRTVLPTTLQIISQCDIFEKVDVIRYVGTKIPNSHPALTSSSSTLLVGIAVITKYGTRRCELMRDIRWVLAERPAAFHKGSVFLQCGIPDGYTWYVGWMSFSTHLAHDQHWFFWVL